MVTNPRTRHNDTLVGAVAAGPPCDERTDVAVHVEMDPVLSSLGSATRLNQMLGPTPSRASMRMVGSSSGPEKPAARSVARSCSECGLTTYPTTGAHQRANVHGELQSMQMSFRPVTVRIPKMAAFSTPARRTMVVSHQVGSAGRLRCW